MGHDHKGTVTLVVLMLVVLAVIAGVAWLVDRRRRIALARYERQRLARYHGRELLVCLALAAFGPLASWR